MSATRWYQVSRKYRMVARLPDGKTATQALIEAENARTDAADYLTEDMKAWWRVEPARWARAMGERNAGEHFLRVHAKGDLVRTLDSAEWDAFIRRGGRTYDATPVRGVAGEEKAKT